MVSKLLSAVAVAAMAVTPVVASANTAASLSLTRASTKGDKGSELAPAVIIGVLATAAIVGGAIALADNSDSPDSK